MHLSRRDFVRLSASGVAASLLTGPLRLHASRRAGFTALRRGVGTFVSRGGTVGWLVNDGGVLVVDSQFEETVFELVHGIRERSPRMIDVLINTHHHPDHVGGNRLLRPLVRTIVAHSRGAENHRRAALLRGNQPDHAFPDTTFADHWSAEIGDEMVHARYYGPAHTGGDAVVVFERANVVHLGDLLNNRGYPNIDTASGASLHGWITVLERIAPEYPEDTIYIFGHSEAGYPVTGSREDLYYQRDYFSALLDAAGQALREGRTREQAASLETLPRFEHFGGTHSRLGLGLGIAFDELVARR